MTTKVFLIALLLLLAGLIFVSGCNAPVGQTICGTHTETYTTSAKGCDNMANCRCLHESWGGLGACDSCECTKEVSNC